jgi:UDP-N-acetylmuramoyl-L-alanyl-D-glutamate--2,6-diaminopimelate ligase
MAESSGFEANIKKLGDVASFLSVSVKEEFKTLEISGLSSSSQRIQPGELFIALPGEKHHGAKFALDAKNSGATALLTDSQGLDLASKSLGNFPTLIVENPRGISGYLADWFHNSPSRALFLVGITGTNGKTTTSFLLKQIWEFAGMRAGLIGTLGIEIGAEKFSASHTTPEADQLHDILSTMQKRQIRAVAIEVSSHALSLNRVDGAYFSAAAFTNLSQDHLDFHGNMEDYYQAKKKLFDPTRSQASFINIDDSYGARLAGEISLPLRTIARSNSKASWYYQGIERTSKGYRVEVRGVDGILISGELNLIGEHNLDNALMAIAIAFESGVDPLVIGNSLATLQAAPGRLESIDCGQDFLALVDYAHTPDAVEKVLATLRKNTNSKLIAILGCGGNRDKSKRPLMGKALEAGSDIAIFTSDNPRDEDPEEILREMLGELQLSAPSAVISDRQAAIAYGVERARAGDILVILGKGHEVGQEVRGVRLAFSDREVLKKSIEARL